MKVGPLSYIMNKKVKENRYRFTFQKGVVWWDCFARHLYSLAVLPGGCGALPVSGPPPVWEYREGVTTITSGYNSRLRSWWEFSCSEVSSVSPSQEITVFTLFFLFSPTVMRGSDIVAKVAFISGRVSHVEYPSQFGCFSSSSCLSSPSCFFFPWLLTRAPCLSPGMPVWSGLGGGWEWYSRDEVGESRL